MSKTFARVLAGMVALTLVAAACGSDNEDLQQTRPAGRPPTPAEDRLQGHRPVGRRAVRHGEAAVEDRADDRLRVAGALAEGPGDRAGGVGEGVQRSAAAPTARASRSPPATTAASRPGRGVRAQDRRRRRGRDRQRPGHRRPGRRVGRDGQGEDPPGRVERGAGRLGRPERLSDGRLRHRRHVPACRRRSSRRAPRRSASSASTWPPRPR